MKEFVDKSPEYRFDRLNKILRENYNYKINFGKLTKDSANKMIAKAETLKESANMNERIKLDMITDCLRMWKKVDLMEDLDSSAVEEAKVILAAKEISDKIQSMVEDAAKIQVQELMPLVSAMKEELGPERANSFSEAAEQSLSEVTDSLKTAKDSFDNAILAAQGENVMGTDMDMGMDDGLGGEMPGDELGGDMDAELDPEMGDEEMGGDLEADPELDAEMGADEFSGDDAELAGDNPLGRELKPDA